MSLDEKWGLSFKERTIILIFFNHCFNSLEIDLIRDQVQKLVSLSIWTCLPEVSSITIKSFFLNFLNVLHILYSTIGKKRART